MFLLTKKPFSETKLDHALSNDQAGAYICFEGRVRNHNEGEKVARLDYEAYADLCEQEAEKILNEARASFCILDVRTYHRYGPLKIGDTAVWVGVLASHRDDAFKAARYIIDAYKARLPIWKKEYYTDKKIEWINAQSESPKINENEYYSKQNTLQEFSDKGQEKLKKAAVLVVGAGGLGASVLQSLAGAGIGKIGIVESDLLEESNLHRQNIYRHQDIGKPKLPLAARFIHELNPSLEIKPFPKRLTAYNTEEICKDFDYILDCTDNFKTKYLLNDFAVMQKKTLISASIYQWEGQLFVYQPKTSSCLRCLWPEIPPQGCTQNCVEAGVLGPVASIFGHMQAAEVIKQILQIEHGKSELIIYNLKAHYQKRLQLTKNPTCPVCGENPAMTDIHPENYEEKFNINIADLSENDFKHYTFVDIRENVEIGLEPAQWDNIHLPLSEWQRNSIPIEKNKKYIIFCAKGIRSMDLVMHLREEGFEHVFSLNGGVDTLNQKIYEQKNRKSTS